MNQKEKQDLIRLINSLPILEWQKKYLIENIDDFDEKEIIRVIQNYQRKIHELNQKNINNKKEFQRSIFKYKEEKQKIQDENDANSIIQEI